LLAYFQHTLHNLLDRFGVERLPPLRRHIDVIDRDL
jgi:hypothetical protein